jgi:hypothetical protein
MAGGLHRDVRGQRPHVGLTCPDPSTERVLRTFTGPPLAARQKGTSALGLVRGRARPKERLAPRRRRYAARRYRCGDPVSMAQYTQHERSRNRLSFGPAGSSRPPRAAVRRGDPWPLSPGARRPRRRCRRRHRWAPDEARRRPTSLPNITPWHDGHAHHRAVSVGSPPRSPGNTTRQRPHWRGDGGPENPGMVPPDRCSGGGVGPACPETTSRVIRFKRGVPTKWTMRHLDRTPVRTCRPRTSERAGAGLAYSVSCGPTSSNPALVHLAHWNTKSAPIADQSGPVTRPSSSTCRAAPIAPPHIRRPQSSNLSRRSEGHCSGSGYSRANSATNAASSNRQPWTWRYFHSSSSGLVSSTITETVTRPPTSCSAKVSPSSWNRQQDLRRSPVSERPLESQATPATGIPKITFRAGHAAGACVRSVSMRMRRARE